MKKNTISADGGDGFLTKDQLLKRLPVSQGTLGMWMKNKKIPFLRMPGGRRVLFDWESVRTSLLSQQSNRKSK